MKKLTKWEVGQDLIDCYDKLREKIAEIKGQYPEQCGALIDSADRIAEVFNRLHDESHGFGLGRMKMNLRIHNEDI